MAEKEIHENPLPEEQAPENKNTTQEMPAGSLPDKVAVDPLPEKVTNDALPATSLPDETTKEPKPASHLPDRIPMDSLPAGPLPVKATIFPTPAGPLPDKVTTRVPLPTPAAPIVSHAPVPMFMKDPPNDLYRRMLPAVLFVLTFVTVMTTLLVYMDKNALGAQQFKVNMSRDYELSRIGQASAPLVAYVRQLHLAPRRPLDQPPEPQPARTDQVRLLDRIYGELYNGTFVEFLPRGGRVHTTQYLETARGWDGVVVRASVVDYYALRGEAKNLHACLSPTDHPREVSYQELEKQAPVFSSRVLCLPLYTVLLAGDAARAQFVLLAGPAALPALTHLPFDRVHLGVIEVRSTDPVSRNKTTNFLATKNYTVAATFDDSIMYALKV